MTLKIVRTPQARRDLIEIWQFIAQDNEKAADKVLDRIEDVLRMLSSNRKAGRMRPELAADLRSFPVGGYVLFYRSIHDEVELVRIINGRFDIQTEDVI